MNREAQIAERLVTVAKKLVSGSSQDQKNAFNRQIGRAAAKVRSKYGLELNHSMFEKYGLSIHEEVEKWDAERVEHKVPSEILEKVKAAHADRFYDATNYWEALEGYYKKTVPKPKHSDFRGVLSIIQAEMPDFEVKESKFDVRLASYHSGIRWMLFWEFTSEPKGGEVSEKRPVPDFKRGQWFLYDKHGFATNYRGWSRGPKFVQITGVKFDTSSGKYKYKIQAYTPYGEKSEKQVWDSLMHRHYGVVSRPKFREKPPEMDARTVAPYAKKYLRWFDEEDQPLSWGTREHGDVGSETPGREDLRAAKEFAKAVEENIPGTKVEMELVDEWVYVQVVQAR